MTEKRYRDGKEGRQINQVAVAWRLNQYNLSTLVSQCCDSPVLEVGSVLYSSYSAPPRPPELPADWCGKHRPRSRSRRQRWKGGRCGKRPDRLRWAEEHLCLLVDSPVGYKRGVFNVCGERTWVSLMLFSSVMFDNELRRTPTEHCWCGRKWKNWSSPIYFISTTLITFKWLSF